MNGPMYKKGGKRTNWLQRHFTLFNGALCYYATKETKTPKGFILTKDITEVRQATSEKVGKKSGKGQFCLEVVTKARTYYFAPETAELRDQWIAAVKSWIGYSEEDVSTKELPQPGASQRDSKTAASASTTAAAAAKDDDSDDKKSDADSKKDDAAPAAAAASSGDADSKKEDKKDDDSDDSGDEKPAAGGDAKPAAAEASLELYEAQYDYDAQEDNELSFKEGDIVTVLDTFKGAGWWKAELNGKIGLCPGNFFSKKS